MSEKGGGGRLTFLAPDVVEAILDGRQGAEVTLEALLEGVPVEWREHRGMLGIERAE